MSPVQGTNNDSAGAKIFRVQGEVFLYIQYIRGNYIYLAYTEYMLVVVTFLTYFGSILECMKGIHTNTIPILLYLQGEGYLNVWRAYASNVFIWYTYSICNAVYENMYCIICNNFFAGPFGWQKFICIFPQETEQNAGRQEKKEIAGRTIRKASQKIADY